MSAIQTLESVQRAAIDYLAASKRPNAHRSGRKFRRLIREYCERHGYTDAEISACIKDARDVYELERDAS